MALDPEGRMTGCPRALRRPQSWLKANRCGVQAAGWPIERLRARPPTRSWTPITLYRPLRADWLGATH